MSLELENPISWGVLKFSEVTDHRLDVCPFYEKCLNKTAKEAWPGWSCSQCEVFLQEKERLEEGKDSLIGGFLKRRKNETILANTNSKNRF